jgi:hypothetical protein
LLPESDPSAKLLDDPEEAPPWAVPGFDPERQRTFLRDELLEARARIRALPVEACPDGMAMVELVLCPSCLRAGSFPYALFSDLGLTQLGSRLLRKIPRAAAATGGPRDFLSVYGALGKGCLDDVDALVGCLGDQALGQSLSLETVRIEPPEDKFMPDVDMGRAYYEAVLELLPGRGDLFPYVPFKAFAADRGFEVVEDCRVETKGISFVPVKGPGPGLARLAEFSFVRQVGEIPRMRDFKPLLPRSARVPASPAASVPSPSPAAATDGAGRDGDPKAGQESPEDGQPS